MNQPKHIQSIAKILQQTGRTPCIEKADSFLNSAHHSNLHFRSIALQRDELMLIASVLNDLKLEGNTTIRSVSLSYNDQITDQGAAVFINSLPDSISELGMVGCGLKDEAGLAILNWLKRANNAQMVCVEGNLFSSELRAQMRQHQQEHPYRTFIF